VKEGRGDQELELEYQECVGLKTSLSPLDPNATGLPYSGHQGK